MPLFPGYLFVSGHRDDCYFADRTGRVAQILDVPDQDRLREELSAVMKALEMGDVLMPCTPLRRGMFVEVSAGPFKGIRGMIDVEVRDNRLILHVDLIGKAAVLEIDRDLLRPVE
jgi:transcription antitermination factor NusG